MGMEGVFEQATTGFFWCAGYIHTYMLWVWVYVCARGWSG